MAGGFSFNQVGQWTFWLVLAYLIVANWQGANKLLRSSFGGYIGSVGTLQGRNVSGFGVAVKGDGPPDWGDQGDADEWDY